VCVRFTAVTGTLMDPVKHTHTHTHTEDEDSHAEHVAHVSQSQRTK